jgi:hypothetical protein
MYRPSSNKVIRLLILASIAIATESWADPIPYDTTMQRLGDMAQQVLYRDVLPRMQADHLKILEAKFGGIMIGNPTNSDCELPGNEGVLQEMDGRQWIVLCEFDINASRNIAMASQAFFVWAWNEQMKGAKSGNAKTNAIPEYFATDLLARRLQARLRGRWRTTPCDGFLVAYLLAHKQPPSDCESSQVSLSIVDAWLFAQKKLNAKLLARSLQLPNYHHTPLTAAEYVDTWQELMLASTMAFVLAHEIGHLINGKSEHQDESTALAEEVAADQYAIKLLQPEMSRMFILGTLPLWTELLGNPKNTKASLEKLSSIATRATALRRYLICNLHGELLDIGEADDGPTVSIEFRELLRLQNGFIKCD